MSNTPLSLLAHSFGERYELPIPLYLFVLGGALAVLLSFLFMLKRTAASKGDSLAISEPRLPKIRHGFVIASLLLFFIFITIGFLGSQERSENIVTVLFWLVIWIVVPLLCGIFGDFTRWLNPFANIVQVTDSERLRMLIIGRRQAFQWPKWLGVWPVAIGFFAVICGELIYSQAASQPQVIALGLLIYFFVCVFASILFGQQWTKNGELFSVLFATWGKLGYFRFGTSGVRGFAGGLRKPFDPHPSHTVFFLLLLVSVSFDGLISTPAWAHIGYQLPAAFATGSENYKLLMVGIFLAMALTIWLLFYGFAAAVRFFGKLTIRSSQVLAGLLPSLLPISFGYLLAHNFQYIIVNGQLLFPLVGNPAGTSSPIVQLPFPFNDSFVPVVNVLPSSFYWYMSLVVIIFVHIVAVVLAHRYLQHATSDPGLARRAEYPWIVAMIGYTMLSLWLLAQPLVQENSHAIVKSSELIAQRSLHEE